MYFVNPVSAKEHSWDFSLAFNKNVNFVSYRRWHVHQHFMSCMIIVPQIRACIYWNFSPVNHRAGRVWMLFVGGDWEVEEQVHNGLLQDTGESGTGWGCPHTFGLVQAAVSVSTH